MGFYTNIFITYLFRKNLILLLKINYLFLMLIIHSFIVSPVYAGFFLFELFDISQYLQIVEI